MPINYVLRSAHFCINSGAKFSQIILSLHLYKNYYDYKNYILTTWQKDRLMVQLIRLPRSVKLIRTHVWLSQISMDIIWFTSDNTMAIFQQKKGSAFSLTNVINYWSCYRRRRQESSTLDRCAYVKTKNAIMTIENMAVTNMQSM